MAIITDYLRPYWLRSINEVEGNVTKGISGWLADRKYQMYVELHQNSATLYVDRELPLVSAYAADCKRMSSASFETISGIYTENGLPRSAAWVVIRSYYAAFFAAHSILRQFGVSCMQVEAAQANAINFIADLYGQKNGVTFSKGYFDVRYDASQRALVLNRLGAGEGVHTAMWRIFHDKFQQIATDIKTRGGSSAASRSVHSKLSDLCQALTNFSELTNGEWLSYIRNRTNYRHEYGVWFPYQNRAPYCDDLLSHAQLWLQDPMTIAVWGKGRDLQRFTDTCAFIVAMCRVLCFDMEERCTNGTSFQTLGSCSLLRHLAGH